jgi:translocation and assembly module TamA
VLTTEFRRRNFRRRDQALTLRLGASAEQQEAFEALSAGFGAAITRESNVIWQKPLTFSIGAEALVTRQEDRSAPDDPDNTYFILAFPSAVTFDRSNNLLDPTNGFRLTARVSPELTLRSSNFLGYMKAQIDGTAYRSFGATTIAGRLHLGTIAGASRGRIAPNRRFYAGGGGSVRGFNFQGVGPQDADGAPTGGNSLTEASFEVRHRFQAFGNDLGVVGFVDAGQVYESTLPKFTDLKVGAGVGIRYFTAFGPLRIDVATPITRRAGDPKIAFYVSIGQAF